jgi:hypothetical protein
MNNSQTYRLIRRTLQLFFISLLFFTGTHNNAVAYGGHGYHHGYGHSYNGYRHYGHRGYGYSAYYSDHGDIGTAGYVFLGILGVAVLSLILDNDNDRDRYTHKSNTYKQPTYNQSRSYTLQTQPRQVSIDEESKPVYIYSDNEGWDWLAKGNASYALDIFAIQSQQNMNSGIPKVGFAIAAATIGETDRATRAMRKAIRLDATALDMININNIRSRIETLSEDYKLMLNNNKKNPDNSFMLATLSYLQQDYATAGILIAEDDHSQSANNLRELVAKKEG